MGCTYSNESNNFEVYDCCGQIEDMVNDPNMNKNQNNTNDGKCMVSLDKVYYKPGDTVEGKIYLKLFNDFPGKEIKLLFYGYEEVLYYHTNGIDLNECFEKNNHYNHVYSVEKLNQNFIKGDYIFKFKIKLNDKLNNSYWYKYKDDDHKAYSKNRLFMIGGLMNNDKKINKSIFSKKIEVFINLEKDVLNNKNSELIDIIKREKLCKTEIFIKAELYTENNDKFIFGGKDYKMKLNVNGLKSVIKMDEIFVNWISELEVKTKNNKKDRNIKTLLEKNLGRLKKNSEKILDFNIDKNVIDPRLCTINSDNIHHNFYFKIYFRNIELKYNYFMIFPVIIKSGIINMIKLDEKFKYFRGNKNHYEDKFKPRESDTKTLEKGKIIPNSSKLLGLFEKNSGKFN